MDKNTLTKIRDILRAFSVSSDITFIEQRKNGLINTTYYLEASDGLKYMLQKINTFVFRKPDELMENISSVTHFLRKRIKEDGGDPERETLRFLKSDSGKFYHIESDGSVWRLYYFVDNSYTVNETDNKDVFRSAGVAFGKFMRYLNSYPAKDLHETIKDFHNTPVRYEAFLESVRKDARGRKKECAGEIDFVISHKDDTEYLMRLYENGMIPTRVTHNDTKLNNVLLDSETNRGVCVIDLDTVMPGLSLYDFGDSMRSGANTAKEDESDLSKVSLDLEMFKAYTEGYLSQTNECLTKAEKENLAFSVKLMTLECGMRFLADYLDGDKYFRTEYPEHNLVRARNQFALVRDIEKKEELMNQIVFDCTV